MRSPRCSKSSPVLTTTVRRSPSPRSGEGRLKAVGELRPADPAGKCEDHRKRSRSRGRTRSRAPGRRAPPGAGRRRRDRGPGPPGGPPRPPPMTMDAASGDRVREADLGDVQLAAEEVGPPRAGRGGRGARSPPMARADGAFPPRPGPHCPPRRPRSEAARSPDSAPASASPSAPRFPAVPGSGSRPVPPPPSGSFPYPCPRGRRERQARLAGVQRRHPGPRGAAAGDRRSRSCSTFDMSAPAFARTRPCGFPRCLDRLVQDHLDRARVLPGTGGQLGRARRRNHVGEPHQPPFGLGHDLLRDHHHVAVAQGIARTFDGGQKEGGHVVAGPDPGNPGEGRDTQLVRSHAARRRRLPPVTPPGAR